MSLNESFRGEIYQRYNTNTNEIQVNISKFMTR